MFTSLGALATSLSSSMDALFSSPLEEFRQEYTKAVKRLSTTFDAAAHDYELALDRFLSSKPVAASSSGSAQAAIAEDEELKQLASLRRSFELAR